MATGKGGKDFLLKIEDSAGAGTYTTVGGLRSTSFSLSADAIEATNHGSNQYKEILDGAGIRGLSVSGSGIVTDAANFNDVITAFIAQTLTRFQILENVSGKTYTALYKITSLEWAGDYDGEQTFSISLESSGSLTIA